MITKDEIRNIVEITKNFWIQKNITFTPYINVIDVSGLNFGKSNIIYGICLFNNIGIDIDNIEHLINVENLNRERYLGFIIHIVTHEFCHLDQDISYYKLNNIPRYILENDCEAMAIKYIKSNYNELCNVFNCNIEQYIPSRYNGSINHSYIRYNSIHSKIKTYIFSILLDGINESDYKRMCGLNPIKKIYISYILNNIIQKNILLFDQIYIVSEELLKFLGYHAMQYLIMRRKFNVFIKEYDEAVYIYIKE